MRHEDLKNLEAFDIVDPARLLDASVEPETGSKSAAAVPDIPAAAGAMMVAAYAGLMGVAMLALGNGSRSAFALLVSAFYLAMFLGVPAVFLRVERDSSRRPRLAEFLEKGMETATGRISGFGALVQMLIVPLLLTIAILAMGITFRLV
jgi:hypothetical protein